jgi:D-glycero-D-manno-heptose 1,7-bisphosphate phosphatase
MSRKAVFLDRDGTINIDYAYVHTIEKFVFAEGAIEGLLRLQSLGYLLVIITNQSGIARGFFTEDEYHTLTNAMLLLLEKKGVHIAQVYFCPHLDNCDCRKPKLGLFYQAQKDFAIDFSSSYAIGDKLRDLKICETEPVKGILLSEQSSDEGYSVAKNLNHAASIIANQSMDI